MTGTTTAAANTDLRAAVETLLDYVEEWEFVDNGREDNVCRSCGWSRRKDQKSFADGLSHHDGCRLKAALDKVRAAFGV